MTETTDSTPSTPASSTRGRKDGIEGMLLPQLKQLAGGLGIKTTGMRKGAVIEAIKAHQQQGGADRGRAPQRAEATTGAPDSQAPDSQAPEGQAPDRQAPSGEPRAGSRRNRARADRSGDTSLEASTTGGAAGNGRAGGGGQQPGPDARQQGGRGERDERAGRQGDSPPQGAPQKDQPKEQPKDGRQRNDRQQNDRQQNERGNDGQDDDEGGSRRNRRRRGRDRQGTAAPVPSSRGHRNEPDLQILEDDVLAPCAGILDLMDNYAFVRTSGYLPGVDDVYVSMSMVRRYGLRRGDAVTGQVRQPREGERKEKFNPLVRLDSVNGADPETARSRVEFAKLTPLHPSERLRLETGPTDLVGRVIDLAAPVGKGQRGLVVAPAQAGRTVVLQALARSITTNNPECHLMVVLVDERPEEVTDFERTVKGEVVSSSFDRPAGDHTIVAELAVERAKRLVELGHDVVVLLDGLTRLGRAYNLATPASGRLLAGNVDSAALYPPKRFFGAARNIENGGSLTIIATAVVESGSTTDEVIFEEFKGTANMEVRLRRDLADKRIFPAVDVLRSGTRREEQLLGPEELATVGQVRRTLSDLDGQQAVELLLDRLRSSQDNAEFLRQWRTAPPAVDGGRPGRS